MIVTAIAIILLILIISISHMGAKTQNKDESNRTLYNVRYNAEEVQAGNPVYASDTEKNVNDLDKTILYEGGKINGYFINCEG